MPEDLLVHVRQYIQQHGMVTKGQGILIALSGGPDSMALTHLLYRLRDELNLNLHFFHLHHGMRHRACEDAHFVKQLAERWRIPCTIEYRDIPSLGGSKQDKARQVRYQLLQITATKWGLDKIALGHNADDNGETVLMRILTGAGPKGLGGIPPVRDNIIRPLLNTTRERIEEYCASWDLSFQTDESNLQPIYLRNRIRLELIPQLEREYNPRLREHLVKLANILQEEEAFVKKAEEEIFGQLQQPSGPGEIFLDREKFLNLPMGGQRRMILRALQELQGLRIASVHVEQICALAQGQAGCWVSLPGNLWARHEYNFLVLSAISKGEKFPIQKFPVPGIVKIGEMILESILLSPKEVEPDQLGANQAIFDWAQILPPLVIRPRLPGDKLQPFGLAGSKKLKEIFIDAKIPRHRRDKIPVIADEKGILWIVGVRRDQRAQITKQTRHVLKISVDIP